MLIEAETKRILAGDLPSPRGYSLYDNGEEIVGDTTSKPLCKRCGRCCKEAQGFLSATPEDVTRWRNQLREDILSHADVFSVGYADLWFDPISGKELRYCPFLKKVGRKEYECTIWETRPEQCRDWWCVLCYGSTSFKEGESVPIGASHYLVRSLEACPECQKRGICRTHSFVSIQWLEKYVKTA